MMNPSTCVSLFFAATVLLIAAPHASAWSLGPTSDDSVTTMNRRESLTGLVSAALGTAATLGNPIPAFADVASGTELPKGAQQFNRIIRLRSDLKVRFVSYCFCFHAFDIESHWKLISWWRLTWRGIESQEACHGRRK